MSLHITDELKFPDSVVTEVIAWIGRRGSGKTYGATKAAEEMHRIGAQFVALDSVGVWYGLRQSAGADSKGLAIPIFGGLKGDVPITPTSGNRVADLIVDQTLTAIVDTSQFETDADKNRFVFDFVSRLFFKKKASPSAIHVFLEEAQEYAPQNIQKGEEKMLHAVQRMIRLGRNYGIGASMISQRPQDISKKVLNQSEIVFAFQLTGPQEIDAVRYWCQEKGYAEDLRSILPKLETGYAHLWSPVLLKASREVHIAAKRTFAAGTTPTAGLGTKRARDLQPIEIEALKTRMAETIEKAKADDPRELRRRIAELELQIKKTAAPTKQTTPVDPTPLIERAVQAAVAKMRKEASVKLAELAKQLAGYALTTVGKAELFSADLTTIKASDTAQFIPVRPSVSDAILQHAAAPRTSPAVRTQPSGQISGGKQRILIALAQRSGLSARQLGLRAGLSSSSGTFGTYLADLRSKGFIEGTKQALNITQPGLQALGDYDPLPTGAELKRYWQNEIGAGSGASRMLEALSDAYPRSISKTELGERAGISSSSGTFGTYLAKLRTLELIVDRDGGIGISEELI